MSLGTTRRHVDGSGVASSANRFQCLSILHINDGSQPKPPSISTTRSSGSSSNTPSTTRLTTCAWNACAMAVWSST